MEVTTLDSDFSGITFYDGCAKQCCELVREKFRKRSSNKHKTVDPCEVWCSKPVHVLKDYCDVIKIYIVWPFLFKFENKPDFSNSYYCELSLKRLWDIEVLEDIVDLAKKVVNNPFFISGILSIGTRIENRVFDVGAALAWVKCTGELSVLQKLEDLGDYCWPPLEAFFAKYKHYITKVALEDCNLVEEFEAQSCENCIKKSEFMKKRGNCEFSKENLDCAISSYTKAIEFCPENHLLYGNRALCFLLTRQYGRALIDGRRATVLKPNWPKGHYRFCEALSMLGEHEWALEANERAQELCKNIPERVKDLILQNTKLRKEMEETKGLKASKHRTKKSFFEKKEYGASRSDLFTSQESKEMDKERRKIQADSKDHSCHQKYRIRVSTDAISTKNKDWSSVLPSGENHQNKGKLKNKTSDSEKTRDHLSLKIDSKNIQDKLCSAIRQVDLTMLPEMLKRLVHDGCTALTDQCYRSAEQVFSDLLNILDPSKLKQLNLAVIDYVVVIYGHATALLGIGQPEDLAKAEDQFNKIIEQYHKERFNCLAHYGIGKIYLRQNRFSDAIHQFMKSQTMINRKIVPGILTWPTTSVVIEETRTEKLQLMLENFIEECKFPPEPDAVCSYQQCHGHSKIQIYFTDPDFKGFIQITCCQQCKVEFHISCWKKLKTTIYSDKNDKDFLQESCFTPDCKGLISKIVIFTSSGLVKREFEQKIPKIKDLPRASVKQKCSSSRKLKIKEEKKLKKKRVREEVLNSAKDSTEENKREDNTSKYDGHKGHVQRFLFASDRVLQHILQNVEQIKTGVHDTSKLLNELLSWWVISEEDYSMCSTSSSTSHEVMEQLISHLIQKKNRVNTRIFVHVLSELEEMDPKLHEWIEDLNSFGLEATEIFFSRYGDIVKELNLSFITILWNEKYGSKLGNVLTNFEDNEILEWFYEASLKEMRCVIWLLEDNREKFPSLHQALDDFFDKMDVPCIILKKQENEDISTNGIKVKNKNRKKKKTKESRPILVLSGGVGAVTREEDIIFAEENTLSFMNPGEPFIIPEYLRDQVEEFEALYDNVSDTNDYQRLLDNNPDPTCENLYDYFAQILEEHGPMEIDDKLLVGEYEHFPAEARKIVEDAGGLKRFLLESLRFVMMDNLIGLMKHAILLKENTETEEDIRNEEENHVTGQNSHENSKSKLQLNPAAKEFKPVSYIKPYMPISTNTTVANCETPDYSVTGYSSHTSYILVQSLPSQSVDTIEGPLSFSNALLHSSISDNHDIPLTKVSSDYEHERTFSMISQIPPIPDVARQPSYIYADYEAPLDIDKTAISDREYISGNPIPSQIQTYPDPQYVLMKSDYSSHEDNLEQGMSSIKEVKYDLSAVKMEFENKNTAVVKSIPLTRMIAIQVNQELADRDTNTMPFYPFETQQGDILRMEKEHQVLQKQLKDAKEKYEQLQCRSSEETSVLEEQLKKRVEENKITQRELDWFHQDLEMEVKKWQQEKKESQEKLKATKNKSKKLADTNEMYLRNIDEKDKHYTVYLDKFLEISNKFANEKVQLEELIKKSKDNYQECIKRAVAAEVSVLENWKNSEVCKLRSIAANAEANIKFLKLMSSGPTSVLPQSKSQIDSWETFISNIKKEMEKVESQYEERIHLVKNGAQLNDLSKVKAADLQSPPSISVMQGSPLINDPAIIMYSSALVRPTLLPAFSSSKDQSPVHSMFNVQTGNKTACKSPNPCSAKIGSVEIPSETLGASYSDQVRVAQPSGISGSTAQNIQLNQRQLNDPASATQLGAVRVPNKKALSKALDNIIERLTAIFPHYTSFDLTNFIKEVQIKNGNKLSGFSSDEILTQVTELILDHQNKKKAPTSAKRTENPASCAVTQTLKVAKSAVGNVSSLSKARPSYKTAANRTTQQSQPTHQPWRLVGGPSQSKWIKSNDSTTSDDDPCIICHEELSQEDVCVLECGHSFHRWCIGTWLKTQSTCPTCRVHALLPEDFPKLPGRNRHA